MYKVSGYMVVNGYYKKFIVIVSYYECIERIEEFASVWSIEYIG